MRTTIWPVLALLWAASARADELQKIQLDDAGPNQPLPVRKSFYLEGAVAPSVSEVWPIFVRYSRPPLMIRGLESKRARSCVEVREALSLDLTPATSPLGKVTGRIKINQLWKSGNNPTVYKNLQDAHEAFVPQGWKREEKEEKPATTYRVLVSDPTFFVDGAEYCLFVYRKTLEKAVYATTVREVVVAYTDWSQKNKWPDHCAKQGPECLETELTKRLELATNSSELKSYAQQTLGNAVLRLRDQPTQLTHELQEWVRLLRADEKKIERGWRPSKDLREIDTDPLAHAIAESLLAHGRELSWNGSNYLFKKLKVTHLRVRADFKAVTVASSAAPKTADEFEDLEVDLAKLPVPGTRLSMRDVLEYGAARLRVGTRYEEETALRGIFKESLGLEQTRLKSDNEQLATDLYTQLLALQDFEVAARKVCEKASPLPRARPLPNTEKEVLASLGQWVSASLLADPPAAGTKTACPAVKDDTRAWPTGPLTWDEAKEEYLVDEKGPIPLAAGALQSYRTQAAVWRASEREAVATVRSTRIQAPVVTPTPPVPLTQGGYIEQFITPIVGYGFLPDRDLGSIAKVSIGLELSFYPNPVDSPMWTNGFWQDLPRAAALQFGALAPGFGPQGRLGSPPELPVPLYAGLALHLVPYVSLGGGLAFVGERHSTLPDERPHWLVTPFFNLSLQANIPALIAGRFPGAVPIQ